MPDDPTAVFNNTRARNNGSRTPGAWQGVYSIKGDHIITDKLRVSGMFSRQYFDSYPLVGPIPGPLAEAFQEFGHVRYWRFNADYMIKPNVLNHITVGINQRKLGEGPNLGLTDAYRTATLLPGVDGFRRREGPQLHQVQHRVRQLRRQRLTPNRPAARSTSANSSPGSRAVTTSSSASPTWTELSAYRLQQLRRLVEL